MSWNISEAVKNIAPAVWFPAIRAGTGADVFTERLCNGLNARGVRAKITWLPHRAEYAPWTVRAPQPPHWANLVHVNSWLPKRFWPKRLPIVATVHHLVHDPAFRSFRSSGQTIYHELLIRRRELHGIRDADAVTTVSDYVRRTLEAFSGRTDVEVIHNWVDVDAFCPASSVGERHNGPFRLFMAGSQSRRKGVDLLPDLAKALGSEFQIRYAGGEFRKASRPDNVILLGRISEGALIREYQNCDAVLSLSRYEGFGYTALEGMACGKPFIGFRNSALTEVVEDGIHGCLSETDDVFGVAARCQEIANNALMLKRMALAARARASEFFPKKASIDRYELTYQGVLDTTFRRAFSDADGRE